MDLDHMRSVLCSGRWSVTYSPTFVKQVAKGKKARPPEVRSNLKPLGSELPAADPLLEHLLPLGERRGWHSFEGTGVNVAFDAKSFRTPELRFSASEFPLRSSFARAARVDLPSGQAQWRVLERGLEYEDLANPHGLLEQRVPILVTSIEKRRVQG